MLALVNWQTVDVPGAGDVRYPEASAKDPSLSGADWILLSSEPFPFKEKHVEEAARDFADGACARVQFIDGEYVSWYGSRAIAGVRYLRELAQSLGNHPRAHEDGHGMSRGLGVR